MYKHQLAMALFFSFMSLPIFAGWTSGGGHLKNAENNPWFVRNTTLVKYCIAIDERNFGVTKNLASLQVSAALEYWKKQFALETPFRNSDMETVIEVHLGTQVFVEVSCSEPHQIAFQFGLLNTAQQEFLRDPSSVVGIAVRTVYDEVNLTSAGFIYISPEFGPLALRGTGLLPNRWRASNGKLLKMMLIHELGHVFGMPHIGDEYEIMGEGFPDSLVTMNKAAVASLEEDVRKNIFEWRSNQAFESCASGIAEEAASVFDPPSGWKCIKILDVDHTDHAHEVYAAPKPGMPYDLIGTVQLHTSSTMYDRIGFMELTSKQQVFPINPRSGDGMKILYLYTRRIVTTAGTYLNKRTREKRQLIIRKSPSNFSADGTNKDGLILIRILK